ncbi:MAG: peptidase [Paenibacillaceae bacterium]|jgi:g-D-glutamyl-meso-diaminopimelate peptidase|nr:peptidase [Paenibacillaceae bacterium]
MEHRETEGEPVVDRTRPLGYEEWREARDGLLARYPFLHYEAVGASVLGRELGVFRIGSGQREIHYNGSMHANEWITGMMLMVFLEELAEAYRQDGLFMGLSASRLLERTTLWLMPLVNPDGVNLALHGLEGTGDLSSQLREWNGGRTDFSNWKANIRGVDLNDQFPANWEQERARRDTGGPGPRDYTGEAPLVEPEALALAEFTQIRSFDMVIAFHTQGREIYWNYRDQEPAESVVWAERFRKASGYVPVKLAGSDAGYKDWFIQEFGKPGFTVEAGFGINPLPLQQFPTIYREAAAIMLEGLKG